MTTKEMYLAPLCEEMETEAERIICSSGYTEQFDDGSDYTNLFN